MFISGVDLSSSSVQSKSIACTVPEVDDAPFTIEALMELNLDWLGALHERKTTVLLEIELDKL